MIPETVPAAESGSDLVAELRLEIARLDHENRNLQSTKAKAEKRAKDRAERSRAEQQSIIDAQSKLLEQHRDAIEAGQRTVDGLRSNLATAMAIMSQLKAKCDQQLETIKNLELAAPATALPMGQEVPAGPLSAPPLPDSQASRSSPPSPSLPQSSPGPPLAAGQPLSNLPLTASGPQSIPPLAPGQPQSPGAPPRSAAQPQEPNSQPGEQATPDASTQVPTGMQAAQEQRQVSLDEIFRIVYALHFILYGRTATS